MGSEMCIRDRGDAPDVDGAVFVTQTEDELQPGDIVPCEVVTFQNYDLIAVAVGAPSRRTAPKANGLPVI